MSTRQRSGMGRIGRCANSLDSSVMAVEKRAIGLRVLITVASLCVVVAGLREAGPIVVPVLFSAFLAVLALPPIQWLQRRNLPDALAVTLVFAGVLGAFTLVSLMLGNSVSSFSDNLPEYEARQHAPPRQKMLSPVKPMNSSFDGSK